MCIHLDNTGSLALTDGRMELVKRYRVLHTNSIYYAFTGLYGKQVFYEVVSDI